MAKTDKREVNPGDLAELAAEIGWEVGPVWPVFRLKSPDSRSFVGFLLSAATVFEAAHAEDDWGERGDYIECVLNWCEVLRRRVLHERETTVPAYERPCEGQTRIRFSGNPEEGKAWYVVEDGQGCWLTETPVRGQRIILATHDRETAERRLLLVIERSGR